MSSVRLGWNDKNCFNGPGSRYRRRGCCCAVEHEWSPFVSPALDLGRLFVGIFDGHIPAPKRLAIPGIRLKAAASLNGHLLIPRLDDCS